MNDNPLANPPLPLHRVLADEYLAIADDPAGLAHYYEKVNAGAPEEVKLAAVVDALHKQPRFALCFSGGGIRSATFNLGVLQGLALSGLLKQFHYLSTVSGGGYIGSWLTAWIHNRGGRIASVERDMGDSAKCDAALRERPVDNKLHSEPSAIEHLREYSNYLSPRLGLFSADTWTMFGAYVRNLLLNWLVMVPLLAAVLALPRFGVIACSNRYFGGWATPLLVAGFLFGLGALAFIGTSLPSNNPERSRRRHQTRFLLSCLLPLVAATVCVATYWAFRQNPSGVQAHAKWGWQLRLLPCFLLFGVGIHALAGFWTFLRRKPGGRHQEHGWAVVLEFFSVLASGALAGLLLWVVATHVFPYPRQHPAAYACFASPTALSIMLLSMFFYIGCVGKTKTDEDREWWARASGWVMIACVAWMGLSILVIYGPCLFEIRWSGLGITVAGVLSALFSAMAGLSGKSSPTNDKKAEKEARSGLMPILLDKAPVLASLLFGICLVIGISFGTTQLVLKVNGSRLFHHAEKPSENKPAGAGALEGRPPEAPGPRVQIEVKLPEPVAAIERQLSLQLPVTQNMGSRTTESAPAQVSLAPSQAEKKSNWVPVGGFKHPRKLERGIRGLVVVTVLCVLLGAAGGWAINANVFSMHAMYRDRLIRAYLGASRVGETPPRAPNLFTGFDDEDNIPMWKLWLKREAEQRGRRLFPVINCTLNLVGGKNLAWQDRKAESFTVTPLHCGSFHIGKGSKEEAQQATAAAVAAAAPPPEPEPGQVVAAGPNEATQPQPAGRPLEETMGYRLTNPSGAEQEERDDRYGGKRGISLGTALTISGAAVSPNWGYHSSPLVTLVMTFFNVRLGWWLGNPGKEGDGTYNQWYPTWSPKPILDEAFGRTDDTNPYIYLSDGGHFENLAVYEMILRRCRVIVACDGGQDADFTFEDLGNLVRKARVDLGIPIEFVGKSSLFDCNGKGKRPKNKKARFAVARIRYSAVDKNKKDGLLVYIKPVVYGKEEPRDVVQYWRSSPDFPHETTVDQFFSESQFESYRALGLFTIRGMIESDGDEDSDDTELSMDDFIERFAPKLPRWWKGADGELPPSEPPVKKPRKSAKQKPPNAG